jgi:hypothetical protein
MTALALLLWAASYFGTLMDTRINTSDSLSPSLKVLISKLLRFTLIGVAILIALHAMGIGSSLAVFSGAIGLGIGFGMQRVFANLVSGVILLLDKSIKPGDVIAVKDTYGWVNTLGGRYVSVITRDGTEHLIPNELLITGVRGELDAHRQQRASQDSGPRALQVRRAEGDRALRRRRARDATRARSARADLPAARIRRQLVQPRDPHLDQRSDERRVRTSAARSC